MGNLGLRACFEILSKIALFPVSEHFSIYSNNDASDS
jgi:hypothetical protein